MAHVTQIKTSRIAPYGFKIEFESTDKFNDVVASVISWIGANLTTYDTGLFQVRIYSTKLCVYFTDKDHAMRFKLVWMS